MNFGFWSKLNRPILALAPMHKVTDSAFRQTIARQGKPSVFFTWFISAEGLASHGRDKLLSDLYFDESERPIVAQIFGCSPQAFFQAGQLIRELGFDGLDINLGCPDKNIMRQGSGAALINQPELVKAIIAAAQAGAAPLPVSVKTRLGVNQNIVTDWMRVLVAAQPAAITLHGRTAREMSRVPNHWEEIGRAAALVKSLNSSIIFLGNGDLSDLEEGRVKVRQYDLDGVMFGRAIFGNPWLFSATSKTSLAPAVIIKTLLFHLHLFSRLHSHRHFAIMKKHFGSYLSGFSSASALRSRLMAVNNASAAAEILETHLTSPADAL